MSLKTSAVKLSASSWAVTAAQQAQNQYNQALTDKIPALTETRRRLNEIAPGHIVNTCNIFSPYTFLMTADVAGGDKYPVDVGSNRNLCSMEAYCRDLEATTMCGWHAPQAYNWANSRNEAKNCPEKYRTMGREITENEMLSVALLYASYGVKGFTTIHFCPSRRNSAYCSTFSFC